jgi:hypothetical protein
MDFEELKKKAKEIKEIKKPEFTKDTDLAVNIGEVELGPTQKLLFSLSHFKGKNYVDIRTWFQDDTGAWKPTKKGVHLNVDKFDEFESLIQVFGKIVK